MSVRDHFRGEAPLWRWLLLLSIVGGAGWLYSQPLGSYDVWWHMAAARQFLETGHFPRRDTFSFTIEGIPWYDFQWLSQVIFLGVYRLGGVAGLVWARILLLTGTLVLLYLAARVRGASQIVAMSLLPIGAAGLFTRFNLGPEHLFFLMLAALSLLRGMQRGGAEWVRWGLLGIHLLIANLHGGMALVSLAVIGIYLATDAFEGYRRGEPRRGWLDRNAWLLGGVVLVTFFTPLGTDIVAVFRDAFTYDNTRVLNTDWLPLRRSDFGDVARGFGYWAFGLLALLTIFGLFARWRRIFLDDLLLFLLFLFLAFKRRRVVAQFVIVSLPICGAAFGAWVAARRETKPERGKGSARGGLAAGKFLPLLVPLLSAAIFLFPHAGRATLGRRFELVHPGFPVGATRWIREHRPVGNPWHPYHFGGYLIWHLYPDYRVLIDGRDHPYQKTGVARHVIEATTDPTKFDRLVESYGITFAIVPNRGNWIELHQSAQPLAFFTKDRWALVFHDDDASIFLKRTPEHRKLIERFEYHLIRPQYVVQYVDLLRDPFVDGSSAFLRETDRLLSESPGMSEANLLRGRYFETHAGADYSSVVEACYRQAIEDLPWSLTGYYLLFDFYFNTGRREEACELYAAARRRVYYKPGLAPMAARCR
ncbi:MAG: hypothetical protein D6812_13485 [Deltaproteobacteria bacterium]|nr:MAG: hypothetical protein D6812_13485 [Deltaproteobacteria bacterium]